MIKQIKQDVLVVETNMIYCDHCGEGLAQQDNNSQDVEDFISLHTTCTKPRNKNLNFLKKATPLKL